MSWQFSTPEPDRQKPAPRPAIALGSMREQLEAVRLYVDSGRTNRALTWEQSRRRAIPGVRRQAGWRLQ